MSAKFVIENWSAVSPELPDPSFIIVDSKGLVEFVAAASADPAQNLKIYEVGECLFDSHKSHT